jgi:chemotaxis protein methyltransferase WspC
VSQALEDIEAVLQRQIGLDVQSVGSRAVHSAIAARIAATGVGGAEAYAVLLARPEEVAALIEEVVVAETWFLRDRTPFAYLAQHVRETRGARAGDAYRVLSVPCSTGEEPYSVAIALSDAGLMPPQYAIDAVDVSTRALAAARRGVYAASSFRGDDLGFRDRYFAPVPGGWEIADELRRGVSFAQGNLLDVGFADGRGRYHAVLCRNLLIYLTPEARAVAMARITSVLAPGGVVIVGHAEALPQIDPRFSPVDSGGAFAYTRGPRARRGSTGLSPPAPVARPTPSRPKPSSRTPALTPPAVPVMPPPVLEKARDLREEAAALADKGDLAGAAARLAEHLRATPADAAAHALLGTIKQAAGDLPAAEDAFNRALYLEPTHYEALVHLALLRERRGDAAGAAHLRKRAARARGER